MDMALIKDATLDWSSPITLDQEEIWQTRSGSIFITTTESPDPDDGLALVLRDGIRLKAGSILRYRREGSAFAVIAREIV
jgi:hypothetical protein